MKLLIIYLLLCFFNATKLNGAGASNSELNDYVNERLRQYKLAIAKERSKELEPVERKQYTVNKVKLWNKSLGKESALTLNAKNDMIVLQGDRLMSLSLNAPQFNDTTTLKEIDVLPQERRVKFIRSIMWKTVLYLLLCHEYGSCNLYTATDNLQLEFRQTIKHKGHPADASFFTQANRLYLVVADNIGLYPVPSVIYYWTGTYMDVVVEAITTGAISVATFNFKRSTIVIFAQTDTENPTVGSVVYEFKGTRIKKIQYLPTNDPVSVHHYSHGEYNFVLLINRAEPSVAFWWDSRELLEWLQLPDIKSNSLVRVLDNKEDTLFVVAQDGVLQLYKLFGLNECSRLATWQLDKKQTVVDMGIWLDGTSITLVLITTNANSSFSIEPWELRINEMLHAGSLKNSDTPTKCLSDLIEMLQARGSEIAEAHASWLRIVEALESSSTMESLTLPSLVLESGTVENINFVTEEELVTPTKIQESIADLEHEVNELLEASRNVLRPNQTNVLARDIIVEGDAFFDEFHIDVVDVNTLDDVDLNFDSVISSEGDQEFADPLFGKTITVHNLEVDSLCGITMQHWALKNDTRKIPLDVAPAAIEFVDDTVVVHSDVTTPSLVVNILNNMNVAEFFNTVFIKGSNQTVRGNITYRNTLQISNLTTDFLNGISADKIMTKTGNQSYDDFYIKTLAIDSLYANYINGVPVEEAARVSRENVIKGPVILTNLNVTDILKFETEFEIPKRVQLYDNVIVHGNVEIMNLNLTPNSILSLNGTQVNITNIFDTYWTKSTDQTIDNRVSFDAGVTIDRVDTKYLNGFTKDQYLYTTAREIPKAFSNLHFENFHVNDSIFLEGSNVSLFDFDQELTVRGRLHVERFHVNQLFTTLYNGLPIDAILQTKKPLIVSEDMSFKKIRAENVHVYELELDFLNKQNISEHLAHTIYVDQDQNLTSINSSRLRVNDLVVKTINGMDMNHLMSLRNVTIADLQDLVVHGSLTVKDNLKTDRVNGEPIETFLSRTTKNNTLIVADQIIGNLTVQNLNTNLFHGVDLETFLHGIFSKSREQNISGQYSFMKVVANNTAVKVINNQDTSKLLWIDEPLLLPGNITFTDLFIENDIETENLNDRNVNELYNNLLSIPFTKIDNLEVKGNFSWDVPSSNDKSMSILFEHAVTKNEDQIIYGSTTFQERVLASAIAGNFQEADEIREILSDAVIDTGENIIVAGRKIFLQNLDVRDLSVARDIRILNVNGVNVREFNESVVRRYENTTVTGSVIFNKEIRIDEFFINDTIIHGKPIAGLALANDRLPDDVYFEDLLVLGDLHVKNLDGVDFDDFVKNRVTLSGDHKISGKIHFNGIVDVTGEATVGTINGITPEDFVIDGVEEPQIITGQKMFMKQLEIDGSIETGLVNDINVTGEYNDGVFVDNDVEIFGDLYFDEDAEILVEPIVSGLVNGENITTIVDDSETKLSESLTKMKQNESLLEEMIFHASYIADILPNLFFYLEAEKNLNIHVPNVKKLNVVNLETSTTLNMYSEESGDNCGLPSNCPCPFQYVAELSSDDCHAWRTNGTTRVRNIHEVNGAFGLNIVTNTVSSSKECTAKTVGDEVTTISWLNFGTDEDGNLFGDVQNPRVEIRGFLADSNGFVYNGEMFIVLAKYYDPEHATHRTNSSVYKVHFANKSLSLHQEISTDGAWSVQIFQIDHHRGIHLLIGCIGDSSESLLYRVDPVSLEFVQLRTFPIKSRHVSSLSQEKDHFVFLDDQNTNFIHVYRYNWDYDNFYDYQLLIHDSSVNGIECFHVNEYGNSDAYLVVTTNDGELYIYEYMFAGKFEKKLQHWIRNVQVLFPFYFSGVGYIFAGSATNSTVLRIVQQGPH